MTNIKVDKDIKNLSIDDLSKKLKDWDQKYLAKYHCPLRWQGNYIVKTIKEFQQNLVKMNQSDDKNYKGFPYNIGKWNGNDLNDKEFVIFTNIRLDFTDKRNSIDKRYNLRVAFKRSLEFAACLYKDKDYCSPLYVFRDSLQEKEAISVRKLKRLQQGHFVNGAVVVGLPRPRFYNFRQSFQYWVFHHILECFYSYMTLSNNFVPIRTMT